MSLYSALNASVSGMAAQANALSVISENISNSSTVGYKEADTQFQDLVDQNTTGDYNAIGVTTSVQYNVTGQGSLTQTTSDTDLAIEGNGFFLAKGTDGATYLTRAGSFTPDPSGNLVNTAGYTLQGYPLASDGSGDTNSLSGLTDVNVNAAALSATPSTSGTLTANIDSDATAIPTTTLPSPTNYTSMTSVTAYNNLGAKEDVNVYFTKTAANTWEVDTYDANNLTATAPLSSANLTFDPTTGALASVTAMPGSTTPTSATAISIPIGGNNIDLELGGMTQLAAAFSVTTGTLNGNPPSAVKSVSIASDGTLSFVYASGSEVAAYKIPLANVESPDNLTSISGDVFQVSSASGPIVIGSAGSGGLGSINADNLEGSTVDLAGELTNMIESQRGYEANSKVFQTGSDMLSTLIQSITQ
jgi:flagellar hook protein FlgE